jgi:hypothetical protein
MKYLSSLSPYEKQVLLVSHIADVLCWSTVAFALGYVIGTY